SDAGEAVEAGGHVPAQRLVGAFRPLEPGQLLHLVAMEGAGDDPRASPGGDGEVVLVLDLAEDLLDDVLDGHDPGGPAVLVDDGGDAPAGPLQGEEEAGEPHRLGHELHRSGDRRHGHLCVPVAGDLEGVLDVGDAGDLVEVALVDGEPAVTGASGQVPQFGDGGVAG